MCRTAFETSELLNDGAGLGKRGWWMFFEVGFSCLMMLLSFAARLIKVEAFEGFDAPLLLLLQITAHRVFADSNTVGMDYPHGNPARASTS
ncbi:MAG TPA: hypothetical protein VN207_04425 [Ktedonobacteraceae bacterium]|nr:hypothetical protein [Ktedonobacteraceae bacterium]